MPSVISHVYSYSDSTTLVLYWDQPPESFYRDTKGTIEYSRREAVSSFILHAPVLL